MKKTAKAFISWRIWDLNGLKKREHGRRWLWIAFFSDDIVCMQVRTGGSTKIQSYTEELRKRKGYELQAHDLPPILNTYIRINPWPTLRLSIGVVPRGNSFLGLQPGPIEDRSGHWNSKLYCQCQAGKLKQGRSLSKTFAREQRDRSMSVMNTWRRKSIHFPFEPRDLTDSRTFCALCFSLPLAFVFGCQFFDSWFSWSWPAEAEAVR